MEQELLSQGKSTNEALLGAAREFAVECAMLKVEGSEVLDFVVDEGVQIYGGYGFSADYPMDRAYRDSRINRIFEGTNEINRMLAVDMILKKGLKGELDLMGPAQAVQQELLAIPDFAEAEDLVRCREESHCQPEEGHPDGSWHGRAEVHELAGQRAGGADEHRRYGHQGVHRREHAAARGEGNQPQQGEEALANQIDIARVYLADTIDLVTKVGKDAIAAMTEGDEQRLLAMGLKRFTKAELFNTKEARRRIAAAMIEANEYVY